MLMLCYELFMERSQHISEDTWITGCQAKFLVFTTK